jgi:hypothetical protein
VGTRCADHATPSIRKSWHYFANSGGRSVGIVRLRTKATEFFFLVSEMKHADKQYDLSIERPSIHRVQWKHESNLETNGSALNQV